MGTMTKLFDWLNVRDYEKAKHEATLEIIRKQCRGSVAAQNGDFLFGDGLEKISRLADKSLSNLKKALAKV